MLSSLDIRDGSTFCAEEHRGTLSLKDRRIGDFQIDFQVIFFLYKEGVYVSSTAGL